MCTSINSVLIGQNCLTQYVWIPRTDFALWNRSVKLEYVGVLPCKCLAVALLGLDSVRLSRSARQGKYSNCVDLKHVNILTAV